MASKVSRQPRKPVPWLHIIYSLPTVAHIRSRIKQQNWLQASLTHSIQNTSGQARVHHPDTRKQPGRIGEPASSYSQGGAARRTRRGRGRARRGAGAPEQFWRPKPFPRPKTVVGPDTISARPQTPAAARPADSGAASSSARETSGDLPLDRLASPRAVGPARRMRDPSRDRTGRTLGAPRLLRARRAQRASTRPGARFTPPHFSDPVH